MTVQGPNKTNRDASRFCGMTIGWDCDYNYNYSLANK